MQNDASESLANENSQTLNDDEIVTKTTSSRRKFLHLTSGYLIGSAAIIAGCYQSSNKSKPTSQEPVENNANVEMISTSWSDSTVDDNDKRRLKDVGSAHDGTDKTTYRDPFKTKDKKKKKKKKSE